MQPYFYSFSEFIAMGKHGVFVWSCWAITVFACTFTSVEPNTFFANNNSTSAIWRIRNPALFLVLTNFFIKSSCFKSISRLFGFNSEKSYYYEDK